MWQMVGFIPTTLTSSTSTTSSSQVCQGLVVDGGVYTYDNDNDIDNDNDNDNGNHSHNHNHNEYDYNYDYDYDIDNDNYTIVREVQVQILPSYLPSRQLPCLIMITLKIILYLGWIRFRYNPPICPAGNYLLSRNFYSREGETQYCSMGGTSHQTGNI